MTLRRRWTAVADRARTVVTAPHAATWAGASLALLGLIEAVARASAGRSDGQLGLVLALLALGTTVPLAVFSPTGAAVTICAVAILSVAGFDSLTLAGWAAALIALHRLGRADPPKVWALVLALPFLVLVLAGPGPVSSEAAVLTVLLAVLAPMAVLGGIALVARREAQDNQAARQVIADTLIEHTARGERARIARELHDVVAHHISMVVVQAESARLVVAGLPPAGAQRLSAISATARTALAEMRRLLGVLREDADTGVADRRPQPGLGQLTELVDEARQASGTGTRLVLVGSPVALDPHVELVAYRIVQEALTNARRHASQAAVDIELRYSDDGVRLRIRDNGPGPTSAVTGGLGLAGMRERASAVGGHVQTGPAPGGGYLVEAVLPAKVEDPR